MKHLHLLSLLSLTVAACGGSDGGPRDSSGADGDTGADVDTVDAGDTGDDAADATDDAGADSDVTPDAHASTLTVRYHRPDRDYAGWTIVVDGAAGGLAPTGVDGFGAVFEVPLAGASTTVSYRFAHDGELDPAEPVTVALADAPEGLWHFSGGEAPHSPMLRAPPAIPGPNQLVVHYLRRDGQYGGWGLHTWQDVASETAWSAPLTPAGVDADLGAYWVVDLKDAAAQVGIIVHSGDTKDPGPDMFVSIPGDGDMVFLVSGSTEIASHPVGIPGFSIAGARAHWLDGDTIAWAPAAGATRFELRYAADGSVAVEGADVTGGEALTLTEDIAGLAGNLKLAYPHLASLRAFTIGAADLDAVPEVLRGELVMVARDDSGAAIDATRVQIPGVLDALYGYDGPLGATFSAAGIDLAVWAPTAQTVALEHFEDAADATAETLAMTRGDDGVWRYRAPLSWTGDYYRYAVTVFHPTTAKVETTTVTDPYAVSLAPNGALVHLADLASAATKPAGWDALVKPGVAAPEDITIYEAHIRDFSASDASVPADARGGYRAFRYNGVEGRSLSDGMGHLKALATAGLSHLHLLPSFDFATVDEDPSRRVTLDSAVSRLCELVPAVPEATCTAHGGESIGALLAAADPTTGEAQEIVGWMRGVDAFNWGYDPVHYNVPEGSYASDPDGAARIVEYREMVQALWQVGLRVVMDVVYNHTSQAGLGEKSVLDKLVPGYYHRLTPDTGLVETSTCCANTATEHRMMRRLMVDSLVLWAKAYKIDAFRFDLMGHHMRADMLAVRAALDALTPEADGVDGKAIYLYGEGWNFGEVANNARGVNATQANMAGTGIGTFNDRLRDAARGGGPFDAGEALRREQGFVNGLYTAPNELSGANDTTREALFGAADRITVGMAGNLRTFKLVDRNGTTKTGATIAYNGAQTGYTVDPQEVINYVDKHDNQTLFDISAYKAPTGTTMAERVRMQAVGMSLVVLGQGVPFLHMGMDLLRSKSMERDSYDSGDWFNRVDWSGQTNNWNVGLPRADKDQGNWEVIGQIIGDPAIAPTAADMAASAAALRQLLTMRASTPLFRLRTAAEVQRRVYQRNVGPNQNPGVLFFTVSDATCAGDDLDPGLDGVVIFVNARREPAEFVLDGASEWVPHPVIASSGDSLASGASFDGATFHVPALSTAVFVRPQGEARADEPGCNPL